METEEILNLPTDSKRVVHDAGSDEANSSGVSWSAVLAGGFVTAALSLILLALGTGLGFASVSVWSGVGASASTIGTAAILWFILIQIMSASMGGYLAGRLRTKWTGVHTDEVYFRDTAHGFLVWAVALVISGALLTTASGAMVGASARNQNESRADDSRLNSNDYFVGTLFRSSQPPSPNESAAHTQAAVIFAHALAQGALTDDD